MFNLEQNQPSKKFNGNFAINNDLDACLKIINNALIFEDDLNRDIGHPSAINECFWSQQGSIDLLKDVLNGVVTEHHTAPAHIIESAIKSNAAQESACKSVLSLSIFSSDEPQQWVPKFDDISSTCKAYFLNQELKHLLRKIRLALIKEGFPCK